MLNSLALYMATTPTTMSHDIEHETQTLLTIVETSMVPARLIAPGNNIIYEDSPEENPPKDSPPKQVTPTSLSSSLYFTLFLPRLS